MQRPNVLCSPRDLQVPATVLAMLIESRSAETLYEFYRERGVTFDSSFWYFGPLTAVIQ
jgi:hypothetical protein